MKPDERITNAKYTQVLDCIKSEKYKDGLIVIEELINTVEAYILSLNKTVLFEYLLKR